jgi:hypothetical protein
MIKDMSAAEWRRLRAALDDKVPVREVVVRFGVNATTLAAVTRARAQSYEEAIQAEAEMVSEKAKAQRRWRAKMKMDSGGVYKRYVVRVWGDTGAKVEELAQVTVGGTSVQEALAQALHDLQHPPPRAEEGEDDDVQDRARGRGDRPRPR